MTYLIFVLTRHILQTGQTLLWWNICTKVSDLQLQQATRHHRTRRVHHRKEHTKYNLGRRYIDGNSAEATRLASTSSDASNEEASENLTRSSQEHKNYNPGGRCIDGNSVEAARLASLISDASSEEASESLTHGVPKCR